MATYTKLKLSLLSPHPAIVSAVDFSLESDDPRWYQQFSDQMLKVLQEAQPTHVVGAESEHSKYHFFAGWQLFHELRRRGIDSIYAVIHKPPPPDIEEWAMLAELGVSGLAGNNKQSQASAYQLLSVHKALWPKIFSGEGPRTPATALELLCNISRSAAQRIATPATPRSEPSLLEKMLARREDSCDSHTDNTGA